jgi:hypothetical protein
MPPWGIGPAPPAEVAVELEVVTVDCALVVESPPVVLVPREVEASPCMLADPLELALSGESAPELQASTGVSPVRRAT